MSKQEMTDKQFTSVYVKSGLQDCPVCGCNEQEITFSGMTDPIQGMEQHLACVDCDAQWVDYFEYIRSEQI